MNQEAKEIISNGQYKESPQADVSTEASQAKVTTAAVEAKPPVADEPPKTTPQDDFAWRFTELTKKEREYFRKEQALKEQLGKLAEYEKKEALKKENPYAYLKQEGIDLDSVAQSALRENEPENKVSALEKRLEEYERREKDREDNARKEDESKRNQSLVQKADEEILGTVKSALEKYEIINGDEEIQETLKQVFRADFQKEFDTHGVPFFSMPDAERKKFIEKCADKVEAYYEDKIKKLFGSSKRLSSSLGALIPKPKPEEKSVTLNSGMTPVTSAPSTSGKLRPMDEEIRRIAAEFKARSQPLQR